MKHIVSIVGARPQFIKAAALSPLLRKKFRETIIHTGQHYDDRMSAAFFRDLHIPSPTYNLGVGSGPHGAQTGQMLGKLEPLLERLRPDIALVYGDTNSTLAGALVAAKLHIPLAHVEAGLRSYNRQMPEEINRIVSDQLATLLFCPTEQSVHNLHREGREKGIHLVGDIMKDLLLQNMSVAKKTSDVVQRLSLQPKEYYLCTIHRAENTQSSGQIVDILLALTHLDKEVVIPLHPRSRALLTRSATKRLARYPRLKIVKPLGYLDMLHLEMSAYKILTDSGGVQKEAYILKVPCITLRNETEWVETLRGKWNQLSGRSMQRIVRATHATPRQQDYRPAMYGRGDASVRITRILHEYCTA
ncbi:MAG: UDP-N-acetylglucosamine 2-epimerase (non-hydrolyzing) [Parcubacteria group bacterium]